MVFIGEKADTSFSFVYYSWTYMCLQYVLSSEVLAMSYVRKYSFKHRFSDVLQVALTKLKIASLNKVY